MLTDREQELEPVHLRHHQVEQDHVGRRFGELLEREAAVARPDDLPLLLLENPPHALAHDLVVVHQQHLARDRAADLPQQRDQPLAVDRLGQVLGGAEGVAAAAVVLDGHEHHRYVGEQRIALDRRQDRPAVEVGHVDVQRDRRRMQLPRQLEPLAAPGRGANRETLALEIAAHHVADGLIVVDDEDQRALHRRLRSPLGPHAAQQRPARLRGLDPRGQADGEGRALAELALDGDIAAHHLAETAADRESEPRAAVLARGGRIGLHEFLEQPADLLGRHPDAGVGDRHRDLCASPVRDACHFDRDVATLRELVGVAHEIEQRLADARLVGMHVADVRRAMDDDFVAVLGCHRPDRRNHVVHQRADREALDVQVHSAGFDLREVEDVVDELEKMMRRAQDALEWLHLLGMLQLARILEQHLSHPDDRVQRRTQLVRHVRQELRLQLARFRQLLALRLAFLEQPRILDGQHRLRGERLQQPHGRGREFTRDLAPDHQRAGYVLVAQQRHGDHRADSVPPDDAYPARCLDVRHLHGRPLRRARSHGSVPERDVQAAQRRDHLIADTEVRARTEDPLRLVELVERSRIRLAQAHRAGDDGSEHRLEVEGRAHRLADLVQHLKLRHRAHQLARARLHLRGALGDPLLEAALILLDLELRQAQLLAHHPQRREEVPEIALREPIGRRGELACRDALGEIHRGVERLGDAGDHAVREPGGDQ